MENLMDSKAFPRFSDLPPELRSMVWGFAANVPREVEIVVRLEPGTTGTNWQHFYFYSPTAIAAVLHTSRESRGEAERFYKLEIMTSALWSTTSPGAVEDNDGITWGGDANASANEYDGAANIQTEVSKDPDRGFCVNPAFDCFHFSFWHSAAATAPGITTYINPNLLTYNFADTAATLGRHDDDGLLAVGMHILRLGLRYVRIDVGSLDDRLKRREDLVKFANFVAFGVWLPWFVAEEIVFWSSNEWDGEEWRAEAEADMKDFWEVWEKGGEKEKFLAMGREESKDRRFAFRKERMPYPVIRFEGWSGR